jgi:iron complex transport system substrate-binding protein
MMRRLALALLLALLPLPALAAHTLTDDTGRTWQVPDTAERVMAAGAPAQILLYTLAPERMVGWNHVPSDATRAYMPDELEPKTIIRTLPERDSDTYDASILALRPQVIIDYGDMKQDYVDLGNAISARLGVPYPLFSGRLEKMPATYHTLGKLLGVAERGDHLAAVTQDILTRYKGVLAADGPGPRVYLAISEDGMLPGFANESWGEVAAFLGARNVFGTVDFEHYTPVTFDDIKATDPDVILALNPGFVKTAAEDAKWQALRAVKAGHVYAGPRLPYDWVARPPSVNRILGVVWARYVLAGQPFDDTFYADIQTLFKELYHYDIDRADIDRLVGASPAEGQ